MKITVIQRERDQHKARVAAYCRVSTTLENQEDSYEEQVRYYTGYIQANEDWEFAGIYSDEKSGTKASNREGFQNLIRDAIDGKVDRILVKSVSRFSRNMVECQKYVKILKGNGVDVRFEKENLDTADPSCTMMFSFLAAIAQDESRSISENVKWAYRERFKRGEYNLGNNRILGYDSVNGKLVPNEDAGIMAVIFQMYFEGKTLADITSTMDAMGIIGLKGKPMTVSGIRYILGNESYVGDKLLQKQAPRDFLTKKPDKNACYESKYLVDDHEAVVSREVWDAVQLRLGQHQEEVMSGGYYDGRSHFLHGRVFCGDCGAMMTRRTVRCSSRPDNKETHKVWTCKERHKGRKGNGCLMRNIPEEELLAAICFQMGLPNAENFPVGRFRREIERVEVMDNGVWVVTRRMVKTA